MKNNILYLKIDKNIKVSERRVLLKDIGKVYGVDKNIVSIVEQLVVMDIMEKKEKRYVFSILKIIELISKKIPEIQIINLGEEDFVMDYIFSSKPLKCWEYIKTFLIASILFIGSAFTIMTFNTDVGVEDVFEKMYYLVLGKENTGLPILEISYSIGLPIGIIVFFNHFSKVKTHKDPTPIQIQMRSYEDDINDALIQNASREGKVIDVD